MAFQQDSYGRPFTAASYIAEGAVVVNVPSINNRVVQATALSHGMPLGVALATAATAGGPVSVQDSGIAKVFAIAAGGSVVAGDLVSAASGGAAVQKFVPSMASSGVPRYYLGVALQNALAGERFSVLINPGVSL